MSKRIYEAPDPADGQRILVDRLWPRGVSKADADLTEWLRDLAPSSELRMWYGHEPQRFDEFAKRYRQELQRAPWRDELWRLHELAVSGPVTLLTATKHLDQSHIPILVSAISSELPDESGRASNDSALRRLAEE